MARSTLETSDGVRTEDSVEIHEIATTGAFVVILLGAIAAVTRWVMTTALDKALNPLREEIHGIDVRLARVEEKVNSLLPSRATR